MVGVGQLGNTVGNKIEVENFDIFDFLNFDFTAM